MARPRTEWHNAPEFAEFAEALGVPTVAILAVHQPQAEKSLVLYTPDQAEETLASATVERGPDGILVVTSEPVLHPGLWQEIQANADKAIEADLRERLGPPSEEGRDDRAT